MKKNNRAKLLFAFLGIATFASLVGTVSGSLAWYAYSSRATLSYSGTSVNNTVQLQIGIASRSQVTKEYDPTAEADQVFVEFWQTMEEVKWSNDSNYYYFAPVGSGLSSSVINAYLKSNGFGTNSLSPVTSGSYKRGDDFSLKTSPSPNISHNYQPALKSYYAEIPFVFRVIRTNTLDSDNFVEGSELWLTDVQARASSVEDGDVYKAIRMFINRDNSIKKNPSDANPYYSDDFILNPSATTKGSTTVGGLLDLSGDHYYDYDSDGKEIIYGEYESIDGIESGYSGQDEIADINGTGKSEPDTFTAKHRQGSDYYPNYDKCILKQSEYECLFDENDETNSIYPDKDHVTGSLFNRKADKPSSVCLTSGAEGHYLGRVDITVYLEGWDHSVIDEEKHHMFDLGLTFEINKL